MGQYWIIAAPSANEVLTSWGKLGECLFDGSPQRLVMRFAIPVLPVDSVQDRIQGTNGCIKSPGGESGQEEVCRSGGLSSIGPQFSKRNREDSLSECAATTHSRKIPKLNNIRSSSSSLQTKAQQLTSLPTEISDLIFEHLDYIKDVLSLSLTCQAFWNIGQRYIHDYFVSLLGPWAGERIICLGDETRAGKHPPGILTEDEEILLKRCVYKDKDGDGDGDGDGDRDGGGDPVTLFHFIDNYYTTIEAEVSFPNSLLHQFIFDKEYHKLSDYHSSQILEVIKPKLSDFYPSNQPWILRNLTTHEYVRADAIALKPEYIDGPHICGIGFGEVILSRICWSESSCVSMAYDGNIHQGVWAGHRFEIVTLARHKEDTNEVGWRDVSEEVAKEIASIWESEYGSGWQEEVGVRINRRGY